MANLDARIDNERFNTDAEALSALSGKFGSRVYSRESGKWLCNDDGTIREEKEYQDQIDTLSTEVDGLGVSVDTLTGRVDAVENDVASLEAAVSSIATGPQGPQGVPGADGLNGGVVRGGVVVAPYSYTIDPPSLVGVASPQLFYEVRSAGIFSSLHIKAMYLTTSVAVNDPSTMDYLVTVSAEGADVKVEVDSIAKTVVVVNTPGVFALYDPTDADIMRGFIVTDSAGLNQTDVGFALVQAYGTPFITTAEFLGFDSDAETHKGAQWEFDIERLVEWSYSGDFDLTVRLGGIELYSEAVTTVADTAGPKRLKIKVIVQFLGGSDGGIGFRTSVDFGSSADLPIVPISSPVAQEVEVSMMAISSASSGGVTPLWFEIDKTVMTYTSDVLLKSQMVFNDTYLI